MLAAAMLSLVSALVGVRLAPVGFRAAISPAMVMDAPSLGTSTQLHAGGQKGVAPEVIVAGGGIGGLCTALVLKNMGYTVRIFEKTSQYRPFGGPIQIASNAAESIRRIDERVYEKILSRSTVIGNRKNGLKDGQSDEWFATFDLDSPARKRGQVSSVVIDRPILQDILLEEVGDCITKGSEVVGCEQVGEKVRVTLSTGATVEGDLLVGSDGIKSRVRDVFDPTRREPVWSGYTCVAGMAYCVPDDIADVGYKVWVGSRKYFVSVDVGGGRIQWYAFMNSEPPLLPMVTPLPASTALLAAPAASATGRQSVSCTHDLWVARATVPPGAFTIDKADTLEWLKSEQFGDWAEPVRGAWAGQGR